MQVLLSRPANIGEWLVTASLATAQAARPDEPTLDAPQQIRLDPGQVVQVHDHCGQPLLEIRSGEAGPGLRLLGRDATVATEGTLRLEAGRLELRGREGVDMRSEGGVIMRGQVIRLN